jgi:hypothetical protein
LFSLLSQTFSYASSIELRVSRPARIQTVYGNFTVLSSSDTISFPVLSTADAFSAFFTFENQIKERQIVIQSSYFFSDSSGRRLVRIFNSAVPISHSVSEVQRSADAVAVHALLAKMAVADVFAFGSAAAAVRFKRKVKQMVDAGLSIPWVTQFGHALAVSPLLRAGDRGGVDGRVCAALWARGANPVDILLWSYPRLFALDTGEGPLPLSANSMGCGEVFLFHTVRKVVIYVKGSAGAEYLRRAFGVERAEDCGGELPVLGTPENEAVRAKWRECWQVSGRYLSCEIRVGKGVEELLVDSQQLQGRVSLEAWIREIEML